MDRTTSTPRTSTQVGRAVALRRPPRQILGRIGRSPASRPSRRSRAAAWRRGCRVCRGVVRRVYEQLAREILEEPKAVDAAEDELYGDARGDELPEQLRTGEARRAWLREAKRRLEEQRAREARPVARSRGKRLKEAKRRLDEELWSEMRANRAYEHYRSGRMKDGRRFSRPPDPYTPPATPEGQINLTDPDSHVVKGSRGRGFMQGYNAQAVANEHQVVIAAEVMTVAPDFGHLEPMLDAAQQQQMERIVDHGIPVLIPPDAKSRKGTRLGWDGGLYAFMRRVLASERGGELYAQRQAIIEPVFANTKFNRGIDRFRRRGRSAVRTEWRLIIATHNLLELHRHASGRLSRCRRSQPPRRSNLTPSERRSRQQVRSIRRR